MLHKRSDTRVNISNTTFVGMLVTGLIKKYEENRFELIKALFALHVGLEKEHQCIELVLM